MHTLISDGGSMTVGRRTANYTWGAFEVVLPEGLEQQETEDRLQDGYIYRPDDRGHSRAELTFVRADARIDMNAQRSDLEQTLDGASERTKGDAYYTRQISGVGLGKTTPGVDYRQGDMVRVKLWAKYLELPVTAIIRGKSADGSTADVAAQVGGQMLRDAELLRKRNDDVDSQIAAEKRERLRQVGAVDSKATQAKDTADSALDAVNDADGVIQGHVKTAREYSEESFAHSQQSYVHSEASREHSASSLLHSQESLTHSQESFGHAGDAANAAVIAGQHSDKSLEHSEASQQSSADSHAYSELSRQHSDSAFGYSEASKTHSQAAATASSKAEAASQTVQNLQPAIEQAASDAQTASEQSSQYSADSKTASEQSSAHSKSATDAAELSQESLRLAELARDAAETSRRDAEAKRDEAEQARKGSFNSMVAASSSMSMAERSRAAAEQARAEAEASRALAEGERQAAETARSLAEGYRDDAEAKRAAAEGERALAEGYRKGSFNSMIAASNSMSMAERSRASAEADRAAAEEARALAEGERQAAETARDTAEQKRAAAETEREKAETARQGAVEALQESQAENQKRFDELEATQDELTTTIQKMQAEALNEKVNLWATGAGADSNKYWNKEAAQFIVDGTYHRFTAKDTWRGEVVFTVEYTGTGSDNTSHTRHISAQIPGSSGSRQVLIPRQDLSRSLSSAMLQSTIFPGSQTTRKYNLSGQALSQSTWTTLQTITVPSGATGFNSFFRVHWGAAANSTYEIRVTRNNTVVGTTYTVNGLGPLTPLGNGARYMGMRRAVDTSAAGTYRFEVRTSAGLASQRATSKGLVESSWIMP